MHHRMETTRELLHQLISFDTTSRNSNLDLIDFVCDYLARWNIEPVLVPNEDGKKANLYATIGPDEPGGIVLSGHTDVVPVDGQPWDTDPFSVVEKDGRLYGRGTCDMKSFLALALSYVPLFVEKPQNRPIHLAFSYDEEVGCIGVGSMIKKVVQELPRPEIVIVGEPSDMKVVNRHKGIRTFFTTVTGKEAHSSKQNLGASAIAAAAALMGKLGELSVEMQSAERRDDAFEPPYTTINIGTIQGGTAINIIPRKCSFGWEYRCLPGTDEDEIVSDFNRFAENVVLPDLRSRAPDASIVTVPGAVCPGLNVTEGSPAETLVLALAEQNDTHAVSYATEAGLFDEVDLPTVVCGPGSIDQAHQPNEFIELSQLELGHRFMDRLCDHIHA